MLTLACLLAFPLAGCKDSDVLTQKIVGEVGQYEVDYSVAPVALDNPTSETYQSQQYEQESENEQDLEENTPDYSSDATTDEEVSQSLESDTYTGGEASSGSSDGTGTGTSGQQEATASTGGGGSSDGSSTGTSGRQGAGTATGESGGSSGTTITLTPGDSESGDATEDTATIVDSENTDSSPTNTTKNPDDNSNTTVTTGTTITPTDGYGTLPKSNGIAATGTYALMVQALGGEGALKACDATWYSELASEYGQAFNNLEELADTAKVDGWGSGTMTEEIFQQIVDSGADVVLTSTSTLAVPSDDWASRFHEAGITVVELPSIGVHDAADDDIETCVAVIGELLKDSGCSVNGYNSKQMANLWQQQHDYALEYSTSTNGGYGVNISDGYSAPWIYQGKEGEARTTTTTQQSTRAHTVYVAGTGSGSGISDSHKIGASIWLWPWGDYASTDGTINVDTSISYNGDGASGYSDSEYYLHAYYLQCSGVAVSNPVVRQSFYMWGGIYTSRTTSGTAVGNSSLAIYPGCSDCYALIASSRSVADAIVESASIADRATATVGYYNFGSPYRIYVMPTGIAGSWNGGTFESFLMAPWALSVFDGGSVTASIDMSAINNLASEFYEAFYRCSTSGILDASDNLWGGYVVATCPQG